MTLIDLANFICGKVNQTEAEDVLACKGFLERRFDLLWAAGLWKDSLVTYLQTLNPTGYTLGSNWLPTKGILLLPPIIERVVAVRSDTRHLNVQRPEFYYRVDYDAFSKQGVPTDFVLQPPCVWEWDQTVRLFAWRGDLADVAVTVKADLLDTDLVGVTRDMVTLANQYENLLGSSDRCDAVLKPETSGVVNLRAASTLWTLTNTSGVTADFYTGTPANWFIRRATLANGASADVLPQSSIIAVVPSGSPAVPGDVLGQAAAPYGAATSGTVQFTGEDEFFIFTDSGASTAIAAAATNALVRQRIRLIQIPTASLTLRVLAKRSKPSFTDDLDSPGLTGVENCLLALAQGDMLQRERHYGKADQLYKEGGLLLNQLKDQEMVQMAHEQRIIPESGYGWEEEHSLYGFSF